MELQKIDDEQYAAIVANDFAKCGVFRVQSFLGDTKYMWNRDNADEVKIGREMFRDLRAKGYAAWRTDKKGERTEQMIEFDPNAERVLFTPPMQGG